MGCDEELRRRVSEAFGPEMTEEQKAQFLEIVQAPVDLIEQIRQQSGAARQFCEDDE